ncbi:YozQ family protein [Alkalihalobacillus sp. BA299]|uniref:YozQ family protein n=1 Tax=Alkalihalobacillus sp. BA299 TaxID=2815938 RepID=UPI001FFE21FF|nr:YozQ family protein [Alkalihalobacillus sp. BA299]
MNKHNNKPSMEHSKDVAENSYDPSDYKSSNETEKGLAFVHEQVSDSYVEGTIDGQIEETRNNADLGKAEEGFKEMEDLENE